MINFAILKSSFLPLLHASGISIAITFFAFIIGIVGGTILALLLLYGNKIVRVISTTYVTIIRGTPMLVQTIALFYILPSVGIILPAFWSAILALGLNSVAYISQIIKVGIQAVGRGQIEAAKTLGFSHGQIIKLIILPQAIRTVLPALGNECTTLTKDSSLASVIGVAELTHQGSIIMSQTYDALTAYLGIALIYLCMTSAISLVLHILEQRLCYVKN